MLNINIKYSAKVATHFCSTRGETLSGPTSFLVASFTRASKTSFISPKPLVLVNDETNKKFSFVSSV